MSVKTVSAPRTKPAAEPEKLGVSVASVAKVDPKSTKGPLVKVEGARPAKTAVKAEPKAEKPAAKKAEPKAAKKAEPKRDEEAHRGRTSTIAGMQIVKVCDNPYREGSIRALLMDAILKCKTVDEAVTKHIIKPDGTELRVQPVDIHKAVAAGHLKLK